MRCLLLLLLSLLSFLLLHSVNALPNNSSHHGCLPKLQSRVKRNISCSIPCSIPENWCGWSLEKVFGVAQALDFGEEEDESHDGWAQLLREGVVALLCSYGGHGFPLRPWQVKTLLVSALVSEEVASAQALGFYNITTI
ncbi:hypothetical protein AMTRI_Chr09g38760 [Amborella trichopoda]|uniref:Leucine-rich repeat-containing N-terminal plant-type domain-containing protein n=2 Tax=Amborella trichopoda TaxID=13333 RepID=W1NR94_AMBTC|nr:hypothetical protein AMTR_s00858p00001360 [Amborella trichopoda]